MDSETIKDVCIESCNATYQYIDDLQFMDPEIGRVVYKVIKWENKGDYLVIYTASNINDTAGMGLQVNNKSFFDDDVNFDCYDEDNHSLTLYPSEKVKRMILDSDDPELKLLIDLKWLINNTCSFYENYGDYLSLPKYTPSFSESEHPYPKDRVPSTEQNAAVQSILNNKLAYVWGAPGTGKTQFVLATAIMAYLRKGKRVAIVTPTNNSLEQVLRGLLQVIEKEDPHGKIVDLDHDVIRIGVASPEFLRKYPNVCEKKGINQLIASKAKSIETLKKALFERKIDDLKPKFKEISELLDKDEKRHMFGKSNAQKALSILNEIKQTLALKPELSNLADGIDEFNIRSRINSLSDYIFSRIRPTAEIEPYRNMSVQQIESSISKKQSEIAELEKQDPLVRIPSAKILAMTTHKLMMKFGPFANPTHIPLNVDHIFIDEIGYCNLIQTLPVFAFGVPVSMLGDHKQLPPVCEIDAEVIKTGIEKQNFMKYAFLWDQSALYCESMFTRLIFEVAGDYKMNRPPKYKHTVQCNLTGSHRFGDNLAQILDEFVYHNGIKGLSPTPLELICIDAYCTKKYDRENKAEAKAIKDFLLREALPKSSFAILTPYTKQREEIKRTLPEYHDNILTVHGSQGREWDTIFLSVADNRVANKDVPLRFTSTVGDGVGVSVINTAVSRAKKRLILVCDKEFWLQQECEMITAMIKAASSVLTYKYE